MITKTKIIHLSLVTIFLSTISSLQAADPVNLMDAKYCNSLVEMVKVSSSPDNSKQVAQKIELCSSSPYLKEHVEGGKARYIDVHSQYMATSGNYYCSLIPESGNQTSGQGGLQTKKVNLKCGLRTEMHASVIEGTQKEKGIANLEANKNNTTQITSPYSVNTSKEVLELAIREAKKDLSNVIKIGAYFKKHSYNNCSDQLLGQLNGFYDPLKKDLLGHFQSPGTTIYRTYSRYGCSPKSYDSVMSDIKPDIEDETYAASAIKPLIEKNIADYESYLSGGEVVAGVSEASNIFSSKGTEVKVDIGNVVKVFFHKTNFCTVLKTNETNIYNLSCISNLQDGFKSISWFEGIPQVSHLGICSMAPVSKTSGFPSRVYLSYAPDGTTFKYTEPKTESEIKRTPKNLNEVAKIKCVTDVKSGNEVTKIISTNLKEEISKILGEVKYNAAEDTLENVKKSIEADLLKEYSKRFPLMTEVKFYGGAKRTELQFTLDIKNPKLITSNNETCIGYAANVRSKFHILVKPQGGGNGFGVALPEQVLVNPIGDFIFSYKNCSADILSSDISLSQDAKVMAGGTKRYFKEVPNFPAFSAKVDYTQVNTADDFNFTFSQGRETELNLLKKSQEKSSIVNYFFLSPGSQSGVRISTRYHSVNNIGRLNSNSSDQILDKKTGKPNYSSSQKIETRFLSSINYCTSNEVVADSCCFGLNENAKTCDLKPLEITNSIITGSVAGSTNGASGSNLNSLQNISAQCLLAANQNTPECSQNIDMVSLGFISFMMEQYMRLQSQLMFQNFASTMQVPGNNVQNSSQASNAVSLLNTQQQANSMLGLYYQSIAGSPTVPAVTTTAAETNTVASQLSPVPSSLPSNSVFARSYASTPYSIPFAAEGTSGSLNSWLNSGGNYGVARDVASEIAVLQNGVTTLASQRSMLPVSSIDRRIYGINAYTGNTIGNVVFPQSYYQQNLSPVNTGTVSSNVVEGHESTTSKEALISIISSLEGAEKILSKDGKKIFDIEQKVFVSSDVTPSLYLSFNYLAAVELLSPHYSKDNLDVILNKAF